MEALERQIISGSFLERLRCAPFRVLLLDYDGTLAPFQVDRNRAVPYPEVPPLIARIMAQGTRVVLISGRPAREVLTLIGTDPTPEIWGSHGLERLLPDGRYEVGPAPAHQDHLLAAAALLRDAGLESQTELKPGGVAVHWRGLEGAKAERLAREVSQLWKPLLERAPLRLLEFDGGLELRVAGPGKGDAVRAILKESGEGSAVAYLGDDQTDEDAFRALTGRGLTVLVRPQSRPTAAEVWLQPPHELLQFFREWLRASAGGA
ncbi:MAG TPA: trehalose-phosphatase [Terriglobales bacterium]|nr:trehalose-phosphatase [Terriglobales bacterium]